MIAFLLLALLSAGDDSPAEPQSAAESVFVRYDLRPVIPRLDQGSGWLQSLVPELAKPYEKVPGVALHQLYEPAAPDVILDLLTQILGDELVFEGRSIALERDNRLLVLAPPAIQERVAAILEVLESVLSSSVHLRLDVLTLSEGAAPERDGRCVVSLDEAERLVAGLVARGASHREHAFQLSAGRTAAVDQVRKVPFLFDYDVEIAQGCFLFDPIVMNAEAGLRMLARGVPVPGGVALALFVGHAGAVGEIAERPLNVRGVVSAEQKGGLSPVEGPQTVQTTQLLTRAVAFNTLLPDDRALVVSCEANVAGKSESQVLVLRRTGGGLVSFSSSAIAGTERTLMMVNTEFLSPPEFALSGGPWKRPEFAGHPWLVASLNAEPSPFLFDWLKYRYSVWRRFGPWALIVTDPSWGDRQTGADLARLVSGAQAEADLLEVEVDLVAGGDDSPRPVHWSLPVLSGTAFGTVLGMTGTAVADYDVEVAQFSGVPDPLIMTTFDGLALAAEISGASAGPDGWILDARGTAHLFRRPMPSFSPGGLASGRIEEPTYDSLQVDERLSVPRAAGAPARVRIGPRADESGALGLVISIAGS